MKNTILLPYFGAVLLVVLSLICFLSSCEKDYWTEYSTKPGPRVDTTNDWHPTGDSLICKLSLNPDGYTDKRWISGQGVLTQQSEYPNKHMLVVAKTGDELHAIFDTDETVEFSGFVKYMFWIPAGADTTTLLTYVYDASKKKPDFYGGEKPTLPPMGLNLRPK